VEIYVNFSDARLAWRHDHAQVTFADLPQSHKLVQLLKRFSPFRHESHPETKFMNPLLQSVQPDQLPVFTERT